MKIVELRIPSITEGAAESSGWSLVAQSRMADVSRNYRSEVEPFDWATQLTFVLIPMIAIAASMLIYQIYNRPRPTMNLPYALLAEIARAHHLKASDRKLLERIAEGAELEQPATLLLGPGRFDRAVAAAEASAHLSGRRLVRVADLRRRLFGDSPNPL